MGRGGVGSAPGPPRWRGGVGGWVLGGSRCRGGSAVPPVTPPPPPPGCSVCCKWSWGGLRELCRLGGLRCRALGVTRRNLAEFEVEYLCDYKRVRVSAGAARDRDRDRARGGGEGS